MHSGDVITKVIKAEIGGSFTPVLQREWLKYIGFSDKELSSGLVELVFKADLIGHKPRIVIEKFLDK